MLLGGVFRGIGAGAGPMATISPPKQMHNVHDMVRWADHFGEPFRLPPTHPMRTVLALRTLLALPREVWPQAIEAIFAAYWQRGEDVANPAVLAATLTAPDGGGVHSPPAIVGAGLASELVSAALARSEDPAIKD
jgi:2-hydroxychromene-2-carboxylate isomerase